MSSGPGLGREECCTKNLLQVTLIIFWRFKNEVKELRADADMKDC